MGSDFEHFLNMEWNWKYHLRFSHLWIFCFASCWHQVLDYWILQITSRLWLLSCVFLSTKNAHHMYWRILNFHKFFKPTKKTKILFDGRRIHENSGWMVPKSSGRRKVCIFNFLRFHKRVHIFFLACSCRFIYPTYLF